MEDEALALEREVLGADQRLAGNVRVTATEMLATRFIMPHLPRFRRVPGDRPRYRAAPRGQPGPARGRHRAAARPPRGDNVVTRKLANIPLALYAAARYLEAHGCPKIRSRAWPATRVLFAETRPFRLENAWFEPRLAGARIVLRSDSVSSIYSATVPARASRSCPAPSPIASRSSSGSRPRPRPSRA